MIHFQGAVFWVSSSMQLIIKLLRPGRIIPAFFFFFFFATNQSQAVFWRRLFINTFASWVCFKGSGKWERSNMSRSEQIAGVKATAESPWVRQVSGLPTHMVHSWEGAVTTGSPFGTGTQHSEHRKKRNVKWQQSFSLLSPEAVPRHILWIARIFLHV